MLYIMGIGLRGLSSITLEESSIIEKADKVYFETYTSISPDKTIHEIEARFSKRVIPVNREIIEGNNEILKTARMENICLLVTGDPLSATTHNQLRLDAIEVGIEVQVMENASIISVIPGKLGLFPYRMAPPVSVPFPEGNFLPRSVCEKIKANLDSGLHALVLLDLREGRTMYPFEALETLLAMEDKYSLGAISLESRIFAVSKVCQSGEKLIYDTVENIVGAREEDSPAALVIPTQLNHNEKLFVEKFTRVCSHFK